MISGRLSNKDARKTVVAFAFVGMLVASMMVVNNVDAAASKVTIQSDIDEADVEVGDYAVATLTLTNTDTTDFRKMEVYMSHSWSDGAWTTYFLDTDMNPIDGNIVQLSKGATATIKVAMFCQGACEAGDTNTITINGLTDPKWFSGGGGSSCGSDDCETDTSPASASSNVTNTITIDLTAREPYGITLDCDAASSTGDNKMFQDSTYQWGYTLTNTGWNTDTYQFAAEVTSTSGAEVGFWEVGPGLANGKELTGQSDSSTTAVHSAESTISIKPASDARPGVYNIKLTISSTGGVGEQCDFDVLVPEPDLEVKDTDIAFSHTGAWIDPRGNSQRVTITAKIRNNGGFADASGTTATDVEVKFFVDGSQLGKTHTIDSLAYGEETEISVFWNPARAHDNDEAGIPIKVMVDPSNNLEETDEDNNQGSTTFKVVRTKASNPSFYLGFLALTAAVGAAVLLSSYYRNKEDLDE